MLAYFLETAFVAMGAACLAYVAAMQEEPVVGTRNFLVGEVTGQLFLYGVRGGGFFSYQSETMGYAEDVRIDGEGCFVPNDCLHDVSCFATYAWQTDQVVQIVRHFSAKILKKHLRHTDEVTGFGVWITHAADVFVDGFGCGLCHQLCRWEGGKEWGSDEVDAFVRTLGREDDRHEQLEGRFVVQFCLYIGHFAFEVVDEEIIDFFLFHAKKN